MKLYLGLRKIFESFSALALSSFFLAPNLAGDPGQIFYPLLLFQRRFFFSLSLLAWRRNLSRDICYRSHSSNFNATGKRRRRRFIKPAIFFLHRTNCKIKQHRGEDFCPQWSNNNPQRRRIRHNSINFAFFFSLSFASDYESDFSRAPALLFPWSLAERVRNLSWYPRAVGGGGGDGGGGGGGGGEGGGEKKKEKEAES